MIDKAAEKCQENKNMTEEVKSVMLNNPVCYEASEETVNVSTDDVNTKRQVATRPTPAGSPRKYGVEFYAAATK